MMAQREWVTESIFMFTFGSGISTVDVERSSRLNKGVWS